MQETWYVLEDGSSADPNEVATDESGALRHKDGLAVAMRGPVPHSRGVDPEAERLKIEETKKDAGGQQKPPVQNKQIVSEETKKTYSNREVKTR